MSPPRNPAVTPRPTLHSVVSPLSIKGAWIIYIYICMHTPPSPASIYFATSRHRYSDSHLTKKIRDFPSFLQGFFHGGEEGAIILQGLNEWMDVIDSFLIYSYQIAKKTRFL